MDIFSHKTDVNNFSMKDNNPAICNLDASTMEAKELGSMLSRLRSSIKDMGKTKFTELINYLNSSNEPELVTMLDKLYL